MKMTFKIFWICEWSPKITPVKLVKVWKKPSWLLQCSGEANYVLWLHHFYSLQSGSLSVNLSLTSHKLPGLHKRLCSLPHSAPSFSLVTGGPGSDSRMFHLVQVFHDKNQHLYINNNMVRTLPGPNKDHQFSTVRAVLDSRISNI